MPRAICGLTRKERCRNEHTREITGSTVGRAGDDHKEICREMGQADKM